MKRLLLGFSLVAAICQAHARPAEPQAVVADTPSSSARGNTFVTPKNWTIETKGQARILSPPEGGSHIVIVDVDATGADAAVAAAWTAYSTSRQWVLKLASDLPAQDGWDLRRIYSYETSLNDHRQVQALALRKGTAWTVALLDFDKGLADKRSAQVDLAFEMLAPKGEAKESFAGKTANTLDAARVQALKDFVVEAQRELDIPGVALGIVQDGKVLFSGGFGVRELGKPEPVDGDTLFLIASNTKALTTLMLAKLVEQGRFTWETPVTQVDPQFRLGDAQTTQRVLIRHLVCACTGMPRQDLEWLYEGEKDTPESMMAKLATMQPTSEFGELFQYSNLLAAAAGFVGGKALHPEPTMGAAYDAAMRELVFAPLGMQAVTFDFAQALSGNHASPHSRDVDGRTMLASMDQNRMIVPARPAGGAWSSANDLLKYVEMELAEGVLPDGSRYIDAKPLLERRKPQVSSGSHLAYGMGLETDTTWGVPVLHHGGSMIGYKSNMLWIPDARAGAVILTNADNGSRLAYRLSRRMLELLYDGKPEAAAAVASSAQRSRDSIAAERKRLAVPANPDAVAKLAVSYRSDVLGEIAVSQRGNALWFDFGGWRSEVASRVNDDGSMSFVTITPGNDGLEFVAEGNPDTRALLTREGQHEYRFQAVH